MFKKFGKPPFGVTIFKERSDYKNVMSMHPVFCERSEAKDAGAGDAQNLKLLTYF